MTTLPERLPVTVISTCEGLRLIRDDHRSILGGFLSAADIVIEFTACEGRHGTVLPV